MFPIRLPVIHTQLHRVQLVGIGHMGCQALKHCYEVHPHSFHDYSTCTFTFVDEKPEENITTLQGANKLHYEDDSILKRLANEKVIILASVGEAQAASFLKTASQKMKRENMHFSVIAFLPFRFEGLSKRRRATSCLESINQLTNCDVIDLEDIRREHGDLLYVEAFDKIYAHVAQLVFSKTRQF